MGDVMFGAGLSILGGALLAWHFHGYLSGKWDM